MLCDDLVAEQRDLLVFLDPLPDHAWDTTTPAEGWTVRDQISHLAAVDGLMRSAIAEPERFDDALARYTADRPTFNARLLARGAGLSGRQMCAWWRDENAALVDTFLACDPTLRVRWFGPPMSLASAVTARIMETWAHGQDVVDALGVVRPASDRLRHVCEIGVRSFPNGFRARGLNVPDVAVRVRLTGPDGETWTWGPTEARDEAGDGTAPTPVQSVSGSALGFALVVTQRRNVADTDLVALGADAERWLQVAQAFAGPPGPGRPPTTKRSRVGGG